MISDKLTSIVMVVGMDERISFKEKEMYIWDVLEKVYEEKGGRFEEREKDMLVLRGGEQ